MARGKSSTRRLSVGNEKHKLRLYSLPMLRHRDWRTHCSQREVAVRHFFEGKRCMCSEMKVWLKTSRSMAVLSVQTILFAAGSSGSGYVLYNGRNYTVKNQ
jgi:hypothetical protein